MPETAIQLIIHTTAPSCLTFLPYFALLCHILPSCHILPYFAILCLTLPHLTFLPSYHILPSFALICPIFPYLATSRHLGSILVLCSNCSGPFYELHQIVSLQIQRSTLILPYLLSDSLQAASCQFRNEGGRKGQGSTDLALWNEARRWLTFTAARHSELLCMREIFTLQCLAT